MKKLLVFLCILICLFSLVSCDPGAKRLDKDELFANTLKIELVDYENEILNFFASKERKNRSLILTMQL